MKMRNEKAGKYNAGNPPPSLAMASERLELVEQTTTQIETRLEFSDAEDFASPYDYKRWVSKATKALGYWRAERNFLSAWIRQKKAQIPDLDEDMSRRQAVVDSGNFEERVALAMEYAESRYKPEFSADNPPPSRSKLRAKQRSIQHFMNRMESIMGGLRDAAKELQVSDADYDRLTEPLGQLIGSAQVENMFLGIALRSMHSPEVAFLLGLVERAIASGMKLTEDESAKMDELRAARTKGAQA